MENTAYTNYYLNRRDSPRAGGNNTGSSNDSSVEQGAGTAAISQTQPRSAASGGTTNKPLPHGVLPSASTGATLTANTTSANVPNTRPRGDSIFLPPPVTNSASSNGANSGGFSRSNSIFSSLIQIPGSAGNSISEQATQPTSKGTNNSRSRQLSTYPLSANNELLIEDLENLLNKESLGNLLALQNQPAQTDKNMAPSRSKYGLIDLSMWNDSLNNQGTSISGLNNVYGVGQGFNGSLSDLIQGAISNGSIDFSNMSNEQRRDSILKIINDQQRGLAAQIDPNASTKRINPQNAGTQLREDIFDKDNLKDVPSNADVSKNLAIPTNDKSHHHLSPASSMSSRLSAKYQDEPQSPKTSPSVFHASLNAPSQRPAPSQYQQNTKAHQNQQYQQQQRQGYSRQQQAQQQAQQTQQLMQQGLPQPPQIPQRLFQNYQNVPQNQYQYAPYPNQANAYSNYNGMPQNMMRNPQQPQQQATQQHHPPSQQTQQHAAYINQPVNQYQQYLQQGYDIPMHMQQTVHQMQSPKIEDDKQLSASSRKARQTRKPKDIKQAGTVAPLDSMTNTSVDKNLVPAQLYVKSEDGRPLLGATKIDQLMLVIQAREKGNTSAIQQAPDGSILGSPNFSLSRDKNDMNNGVLPAPVSLVGGVDKPVKGKKTKSDDEDGEDGGPAKRKRLKNQQCPYCFKYFTQSTHLEVHIRSHIGYKPFECSYCHKKFTQGGNLRTHLRLHTGEKPFTCDVCNRSFSRKGNLAAHKLTHDNLKPYECRLDGCDKSFTQLGNLKSHQNRFHLNTLNDLTHKLAELSGAALSRLPPDEKELLDYFKDLYKNSNKGIRGRGKLNKEVNSGNSASPGNGSPPIPAGGVLAGSPTGSGATLTDHGQRGQYDFLGRQPQMDQLQQQDLLSQQHHQQRQGQQQPSLDYGFRNSNQLSG